MRKIVKESNILNEISSIVIPDTTYMCKYYSGVVTVTSGGGDVTVNIPFDWTGGRLNVVASGATTRWGDEGTTVNTIIFDASYDSLTNASYTVTTAITHRLNSSYHYSHLKTDNIPAMPKAATTTSFTLDDAGVTIYAKYFIWA